MTVSGHNEASDARKTKKQLIEELRSLRGRVSDLERHEFALSESERRLRKILDNSPIGVSMSRISDGAMLYSNARIAELFGLDEIGDQEPTFASYYQDPDRRDEIYRRLEMEGSVEDVEISMRRGDGSTFPALLTGLVHDYEGEPARLG